MTQGSNAWQITFFFAAALFVAFQIVRGWRLGVVRQLFNMLGLVAAYLVAIFGGRLAAPVFRPLGYPDIVVSTVAGALLGIVVFAVISATGAIVFRKTSQQNLGLVRLGYGAGGSAIGVVFGILMVWFAVLGIRLLGSIAEAEIQFAQPAAHAKRHPKHGGVVQGLAEMKHSLEQGRAGAVMQKVDPMPAKVYDIIGKIGRVISDPERAMRFMNYPGAKSLSQHPKIRALQSDPAIAEKVEARDFVGLMKNQHLVNAANDAEIGALVRNFELEKALDYALKK